MCQFIETIRIEDGQVYNLSYHTARMNRTRAPVTARESGRFLERSGSH